jgi:hypothetical protein
MNSLEKLRNWVIDNYDRDFTSDERFILYVEFEKLLNKIDEVIRDNNEIDTYNKAISDCLNILGKNFKGDKVNKSLTGKVLKSIMFSTEVPTLLRWYNNTRKQFRELRKTN